MTALCVIAITKNNLNVHQWVDIENRLTDVRGEGCEGLGKKYERIKQKQNSQTQTAERKEMGEIEEGKGG